MIITCKQQRQLRRGSKFGGFQDVARPHCLLSLASIPVSNGAALSTGVEIQWFGLYCSRLLWSHASFPDQTCRSNNGCHLAFPLYWRVKEFLGVMFFCPQSKSTGRSLTPACPRFFSLLLACPMSCTSVLEIFLPYFWQGNWSSTRLVCSVRTNKPVVPRTVSRTYLCHAKMKKLEDPAL